MKYVLVVSFCLLIGCSQPPTEIMQQASTAIQRAEQEGRNNGLEAARSKFVLAEAERKRQDDKHALFRSYGMAKMMYHDALTAAQTAGSGFDISNPQRNISDDVEFLVEQVKSDLARLEESTNRLLRRLDER